MSDRCFDRPILNSPYLYPSRHWELDESGQPTRALGDETKALEAGGQQYELGDEAMKVFRL